MGAALPVAALAVQTVGTVAKGIGAKKDAYKAAKVDDANAQLDLLEGEQEALGIAREERQQAGLALTALAGSGIAVGSGTPADILADSAYQRELDIDKVRQRAFRQFQNDRQAAKDKRRAGKNALIGSVFGAVAGALEGAAGLRRDRILSQQAGKERSTRSGGGI